MQLHAGAGRLIRSAAADFSLLPRDRSFRDLLLPFVLPYLAYVLLGSFLPGLLGDDLAQGVRFLAVGGLLLRFRGTYSLGPRLAPAQIGIALAGGALATVLWVGLLRLDLSLPLWSDQLAKAEAREYSLLYWVLRTSNSVLLVPLLEELFVRAYAQEAALPPGPGQADEGLLDRKPRALPGPPVQARPVLAATVIFVLGHNPPAWIPAIAYFLFTTALYAWTRSFRVCVLTHAVTNGAIAALVWMRPDSQFLWF